MKRLAQRKRTETIIETHQVMIVRRRRITSREHNRSNESSAERDKSMQVLIVLLTTFTVTAAISRIARGRINYKLCGCIALAAMFVMTGISHFVMSDDMIRMLPDQVPARIWIIYLSGAVELLFAIGLLIPGCSRLTGKMIILFLLLVFPANVYAAFNSVEFGGNVNGPLYLLFRAPLQVLLILWAWFFAVRNRQRDRAGQRKHEIIFTTHAD